MSLLTNPPSLWGLEVVPEIDNEGREAVAISYSNYKDQSVTLYEDLYETRGQALKNIGTLPFRAVGNVTCHLVNTVALGYFSARNDWVEDTWGGQFKGASFSLLSLGLSPLALVVDIFGHLINLYDPRINKINLLAMHMWCGFITANNPNNFDEE